MKIIVPATSANVGPGFDSVGIAVTRYLTIEVLEPADAWFIEHDLGAGIPTCLLYTSDYPATGQCQNHLCQSARSDRKITCQTGKKT